MSGETLYDKRMYKSTFFTNAEIYRRGMELFNRWPVGERVRTISIFCYQLTPFNRSQLSLFEEVNREEWITTAMDVINDFYGPFTVFEASTILGKQSIKQKIPFGGTEYFELLLKRA